MPRRRANEARTFRIEPLSPDLLSIMYPVVAAAYPTVRLESWQSYAGTIIASPPDRCGLLGLRGDDGYFCGLLIYRNGREPWREPRLAVDLFIALDLVNPEAATNALLAAAEMKAVALACEAVEINVEHGLNIDQHLKRAGYRSTAELMTKRIAAPPRVN